MAVGALADVIVALGTLTVADDVTLMLVGEGSVTPASITVRVPVGDELGDGAIVVIVLVAVLVGETPVAVAVGPVSVGVPIAVVGVSVAVGTVPVAVVGVSVAVGAPPVAVPVGNVDAPLVGDAGVLLVTVAVGVTGDAVLDGGAVVRVGVTVALAAGGMGVSVDGGSVVSVAVGNDGTGHGASGTGMNRALLSTSSVPPAS